MCKSIAGIFKIFLALFLMEGGVFVFGISAHAATITDIYDQPSSLQGGVVSNHKITFTLTSAVNEGSTLTISFPASFDTSTITEDDLDISDDGVELTTESTCLGTEQISASIAGDVVTFTVCAGDGGAMTAGSVVVIEIGTNASASGAGTHRVSNPSSAGTYMLALGGTFGDKGSIPLPISSGTAASGVSGVIVAPVSTPPDSGRGPAPSPDDEDDEVTDPVTDPDEEDPEPDPTPDPEPDSDATDPDEDVGGNDDVPDPSTGGTDQTPSDDAGESSGGTDSDDVESGDQDAGEVDAGDEVISVTTGIISPEGVVLAPSGESFALLGGTTPVVQVEVSEEVSAVQVLVNGDVYPLTAFGNTYSGEISVPLGDGFVVVEVTRDDGGVTRETYALDVVAGGMVYEDVDGSRVPIAGAVVTVYKIVNGVRIAYSGSANPVVFDASGAFAWYVPNGTYVVTAAKMGFADGNSGVIVVRNNILAPSIMLERFVEAIVEAPDPAVTTPTPIPVESSATSGVVTAVAQVMEDLRASPEVQVAIDIATPAAAVLAGTSVVVLASSFQLWPFLQYLITSPVLFFARRKRTAYGTVYNAATKLPIDLAIVRVFALPERKLLRTVVTNAKGKYLLTVAPGRYALEVTKPNFTFPTTILAGKKDDGTYLDVYSGQEIEVTENDAVIAANIPMDPSIAAAESAHHAVTRRCLRVLQQVIALVGVMLSLAVLVISPTLVSGVMCGVQIAVYMLARRLAHPRRPKGWGIVYDAVTREPVGNAVVRLFEPTYNKLIETVVTDRLGRYAFLVGPSEYYVTYAKPGYAEKTVRPLDYRNIAEPSTVALDVPIDEAKA